MNRIGIGQDSHAFSLNKSRPLVLGGIIVSQTDGLEGNSDADVIIHSLCNALSSSIGGESLSTWTDEMCQKGITDSKEYLKVIFNKIQKNKFIIENISIAVEAKTPYLTSIQKQQVKKCLALILKIKTDQIGITYTSGEGLTPFGQKKGIQSFATVLLKK